MEPRMWVFELCNHHREFDGPRVVVAPSTDDAITAFLETEEAVELGLTESEIDSVARIGEVAAFGGVVMIRAKNPNQ